MVPCRTHDYIVGRPSRALGALSCRPEHIPKTAQARRVAPKPLAHGVLTLPCSRSFRQFRRSLSVQRAGRGAPLGRYEAI